MSEQTATETPAEAYAYLAKSGMIHTEPKCMNFIAIEKADTPAKQAKVGAVQISLTDAFKRVQSGAKHCGMCIKIQQEEAAKKSEATTPPAPVAPQEPAKPAKAAAKAPKDAPKPEAKATPAKPAKVEGKGNGTNAITLFEVFKVADDKGELAPGAYTAYKLKVKAVLTAVGYDLEKTDLTKLDVAETLKKFEAASPTLLESTRRSYKDAFKRAVRLFNAYVEDPKNWDPTAKAERAPRVSGGPNPTKSQVRAWALEQGKVKKDELGPNYVPVALINAYKEAHASA
jgi:hypothetical protein